MEFFEVSNPIIAGEASKVPGVEKNLRKRCNAHIRFFGAIKDKRHDLNCEALQ